MRRVRLGQTDVEVAADVLGDLAAMRWDHEPLLRRVWELREKVTASDTVYVVLAETLVLLMLLGFDAQSTC